MTGQEIVQSVQDLSPENSASENEDEKDIESYIPLHASESDSSFDLKIRQIENLHKISSSSSDNEADGKYSVYN